MAAWSYGIENFEGILNWVKENLTREEVNTLFFATDNEGRTIFHAAVRYFIKEKFQGILNLAKENLTREEVNKSFFATENEGRTVFHAAAMSWELEIFQRILN